MNGRKSNVRVRSGARDDSILRKLREQVDGFLQINNKKQSVLAAGCGVDAADLTHFLSGERSLPAYALANLAVTLEIDPAHLLLYWEQSQYARKLHDHFESDKPASVKTRGWEIARDTIAALMKRLPNYDPARTPTQRPGTLLDWPMAFLPIVIFVGDRREMPPQSPADLIAASASMGDLYYLPRLRLPHETEIRSDKTCVVANQDNLRTLVQGKNLLIIGSPAANLMAREVNKGACFSFHVSPDALIQAPEFQKVLDPIKHLPGELEKYADVNSETATEKKWSRLRRHMIYGFARSGILDPVDYVGLRASATNAHSDYGVVSLCRHPWSEYNVAIMAAGLHGPGTAAAIKLLSQENAFAGRPLGGVFRVHVPIETPWEERYQHLNPKWDTHEYSLAQYEEAVRKFTDTRQKDLDGELRFWDPKDVNTLLHLIRSHAY